MALRRTFGSLVETAQIQGRSFQSTGEAHLADPPEVQHRSTRVRGRPKSADQSLMITGLDNSVVRLYSVVESWGETFIGHGYRDINKKALSHAPCNISSIAYTVTPNQIFQYFFPPRAFCAE